MLKTLLAIFTIRKAVYDFTDFRTGERYSAKARFRGRFDHDYAIAYIKSELPHQIVPVEWDFKGIEG
jgi:hypothetical protein